MVIRLPFLKPRKIDVRPQMNPAVREQVLKNHSGVLEIMSKNIKDGNKCCPFLLGSPCIGEMCMHFQQFTSISHAEAAAAEKENRKPVEKEYWICAHIQQNLLTVELNRNIRELINLTKGKGHENPKPV